MRISELSDATGVAVHTITYYLRVGLLPPGELTSRTRAEYGPDHVSRVRLIRALVQGAGVSIDGVRQIIDALENPPADKHELFGVAQEAVPAPDGSRAASAEVRAVLTELGWDEVLDNPFVGTLTAAVETARDAGLDLRPEHVVELARAVEGIARIDVGHALQAPSVEHALLLVAAGTVVTDPILAALRRLAQQHVSAEVAAGTGLSAEPRPPSESR